MTASSPNLVGFPDPSRFPPGFVWGAATSSYQIEGAVDVDGRGPSIWDTFSHSPGRTFAGDTGDRAAEHYERFREDVRLCADLGLSAYRFSVAWPRVLPDGYGRVEQRGLDFYRRLVDELLEHGVEPWLTLYHWDLPQRLQDEGGWPSRDTAFRFAEYATVVFDALSDRPVRWSTLNEPWCSSLLSHVSGVHAPGETDPPRAARAVHHLLLAHGLAAGALRSAGVPDLGVTLNLAPVVPASSSPADVDAARLVDGQQNRLFLDPLLLGRYPRDVLADLERAGAPLPVQDGDLDVTSAPLDWLGVNYYFRTRVRDAGAPSTPPFPAIGAEHLEEVRTDGLRTAMGWGVEPSGLVEVTTRLSREYPAVPLVVTENGSAWDDVVSGDGAVHDAPRSFYLASHLSAAADALKAGVDLRGYFAWSLLDNFEWSFGYSKRFGIVHVDFDSQRRTIKDSGLLYSAWVRSFKEASS